jgi:D-serine deaminase-like pyridoxal phosphate-dependent protein
MRPAGARARLAGRSPGFHYDRRVAEQSPYARLEAALGGVEPPFAVVDLDALRVNAAGLAQRAAGKPIRVASKSVRCRAILHEVLQGSAFRGLMTFTLRESLWLRRDGFADLLLGYPTADRGALADLGALDAPDAPVLMIDSTDHLDLIDAAAPPAARARPVRVCLDFDTSLELARGRIRIGPKRSPLRTPRQVAELARAVVARPGFALAGVMGYEGHVAGVGDRPPNPLLGAGVRAMQRAAIAQVAARRAAVVDAVRAVAPLPLVNGGGTGSLGTTAAEPAVTEVTAGSGLFGPGLFDHYRAFRPRPAALFCLPVVRRPAAGVVTVLGGGYVASGPAGRDRLPTPHLPAGLKLTATEGAGEVQTPLTGRSAGALRPGDRVYLRHAKAGELCERFTSLLLLEGDRVVGEVPTYRGDGHAFL